MAEVFVGVGSNIDPARRIVRAVAALEARFPGLRCSDVFRSPAFGFTGGEFLNLVVAFSTDAGPDGVAQALRVIEHEGGRSRRRARRSRVALDLDVLLYGGMVDAARRLPREDVRRHPFALAPLADLAPELCHPLTGLTLREEWLRMSREATALERIGAIGSVRAATSRCCGPHRPQESGP